MTIDNLHYEVFPTRREMGLKAATDVAATIKKLLETKETIGMILQQLHPRMNFSNHLFQIKILNGTV